MVSVIKTVIDILTISVGILSLFSLSVIGFNYLSAKDNLGVQKSKKHLFEIIIGFTVFASVTVVLKYLPL